LVPVPEGFVVMRATRLMPMLATPLLSPFGKLRFLAERWIKPRSQPKASTDDESIGSFVRRRMGQQVLDRIVTPLAAGIYTGDIDRLSMLATMGPVAEMERRYGSLAKANKANRVQTELSSAGARYDRFRSFRGGMVQLINGLANSLPAGTVQTNTTIRDIHRVGDKFQVSGETKNGNRTERTFDQVIVSTPPKVAGKLLANLATVASSELLQIEATSTAIVVLGLRRSDISADISMFGFVVPPAENRKILAGSFASNKFAGRAPDGTVIVRCFFGGALQSEILRQSDDQLIEIARQELSELIGLAGSPLVTRVVRWNEAMPQYHVGHLDRVARIESDIDSIPGLTLISNALRGVGIASVIRSADQAAKSVMQNFTNSGDTSGRDGIDAAAATE
jgi:oxygen-dependent protoporphyrinogen oxidase